VKPIDKLDSWLIKLRASNPVWGWTLTVLLGSVALLISVGILFSGFLLGPMIAVIGFVWALIFVAFSIVGKFKPEYRIENLMEGPHGTVILVLGIVIVVLGTAVTVLVLARR
jgi:hypothetical protein